MIEIKGINYTYIVPKEKINCMYEDKRSSHQGTWYYISIEGIGDVEIREGEYKFYKKELFGIEEKKWLGE